MSDIWIVDDEPAICWALRTNLEEDRHRVKVFSTGESFLKDIEKGTPDLVLLDVRLPGVSGLELLKRLRGDHPRLPVIVMTAFGDISTAVQAVQGSAFEYLTKPFDLEEALQTIRKALAQSHLKPLSPKGSSDLSSDVSLGKSAAMQSVYKQIAVAATTDSSLLIEGEEGTGKNLVAVMIHRFSSRNTQPLLMTSSTPGKDFEFETELFGSGGLGLDTLQPLRTGLLELAGQGTLVIDDVGSISLANQQKILRAIEIGRAHV